MEPRLITAPPLLAVLDELRRREPLFHRPELGTRRRDFENMTDAGFWEVGASGRRYSREFVLDTLAQRFPESKAQRRETEADRREIEADPWETRDFYCLEVSADNYLITYTLRQGARVTRRSTLWRRIGADWRALYHQGTLVAEAA